MTLEQMKNVDISTVDPKTVVCSDNIIINTDLPVVPRMKDYQRQAGNVYYINVDGIIVKMSYSDTNVSATERYEQLLRMH